jgi:predicted metal-binding membrane protein
MSWYNPMSWSDKVIDNVLDKDDGLLANVGSWIGGQQYTDEEIAEANTELRKGVVAYAIASMGENSERSIARREIAKQWIKVQLWLVLMCAIAAPFNMELAEFYYKLSTSSIMLGGTVAIITFFFGSYMLTRHNETKK